MRPSAVHHRSITVGILDEQQLLLDGLIAWLGVRSHDVEVAIACRTWSQLLGHERFPVDVVLLDLGIADGLSPAVKIATLRMTGVATVVVSMQTEAPLIRECLSSGALGFVPKSDGASTFLEAIRVVHRGGTYLSPAAATALAADEAQSDKAPKLSEQELRVLVLYASGLPMKSVARRMDISYETAKSYLGRVRDKYADAGREARSKIDLRRRAIEDGWISGR